MEHFGAYIVLLGSFIIVTAKFTVFISALKKSVAQGLFCLIIPAFFLYYMRKENTRMPKTLTAWYSGFVTIILGILIASF